MPLIAGPVTGKCSEILHPHYCIYVPWNQLNDNLSSLRSSNVQFRGGFHTQNITCISYEDIWNIYQNTRHCSTSRASSNNLTASRLTSLCSIHLYHRLPNPNCIIFVFVIPTTRPTVQTSFCFYKYTIKDDILKVWNSSLCNIMSHMVSITEILSCVYLPYEWPG